MLDVIGAMDKGEVPAIRRRSPSPRRMGRASRGGGETAQVGGDGEDDTDEGGGEPIELVNPYRVSDFQAAATLIALRAQYAYAQIKGRFLEEEGAEDRAAVPGGVNVSYRSMLLYGLGAVIAAAMGYFMLRGNNQGGGGSATKRGNPSGHSPLTTFYIFLRELSFRLDSEEDPQAREVYIAYSKLIHAIFKRARDYKKKGGSTAAYFKSFEAVLLVPTPMTRELIYNIIGGYYGLQQIPNLLGDVSLTPEELLRYSAYTPFEEGALKPESILEKNLALMERIPDMIRAMEKGSKRRGTPTATLRRGKEAFTGLTLKKLLAAANKAQLSRAGKTQRSRSRSARTQTLRVQHLDVAA